MGSSSIARGSSSIARARRMLAGIVMVSAAAAVVPPASAGAQGVQLHIKPRVGDTMHTRFEQEMVVTGRTRVGNADTTLTMRTSMLLLSRVVVEGSDSGGVLVLAITDSLSMRGSGSAALISEPQRRALQSGRVRMRISPEGVASVLDAPAALAPDLQSVVSQMPATLPRGPIRVGSTWTQEMTIPVAGPMGGGAALLRATFRLDSLTRGGELAHISMQGRISRDSTPGDLPRGASMASSSGTLRGYMLVDRRRGWWTDSRATITMQSVMHPPAGSGAEPMRFETRITHRMWTERK
jgi:hypothetical protein